MLLEVEDTKGFISELKRFLHENEINGDYVYGIDEEGQYTGVIANIRRPAVPFPAPKPPIIK